VAPGNAAGGHGRRIIDAMEAQLAGRFTEADSLALRVATLRDVA
jgi:hypothetical protein